MRFSMLVGLSIAVITSVAFPQSAKARRVRRSGNMAKAYDGEWWLASVSEERSGFLEGSADCLTWVAHADGYSGTSNRLADKITRYYKAHPDEKHTAVIDVWQRVREVSPSKPTQNGEVWKNAHWYLNGLWWRDSSESERMGFLKGYLWCVDSRDNPQKGAYSRSPGSYMAKIDEYVRVHPKADDEAIAAILERCRDGSGKTDQPDVPRKKPD